MQSVPPVAHVKGLQAELRRRPAAMVLGAQAAAAAAAALLMSLTAPLQSAPERRVLGAWLTWVAWPGRQLVPHRAPPWLLVVAVVLVVSAWVAVAVALHRQEQGRSAFAVGCALWCSPFVVGVPVFSRDAYAYVAQGTLLQRGLDPYVSPVAQLGPSSVVRAVDPVWRHTLTPYGPFGVRLEQLAVWAGGDELGALLVLRLLCLACVALSALCIWKSSVPPRRQLTLWLLLSPLLLVHLVAGLHLDAVVLAALSLGAAAVVRGRWTLAIGLVVTAGEVKATAFAVLPVLFLFALRAGGLRRALTGLASGLAVAAVGAVAYLRDPWGWVMALRTPASTWDPFTPASTVALAVSEAMHHLDVPVPSTLLPATQVLAMAVGAAALVTLVLTNARRQAVETCAWVMLVVLVASPAMWAWYLTASVPFLLLVDRARLRVLALLLGSAGLLVGLPLKVVPAQRIAVLTAAVAVGFWYSTQRERA